MFVESKSHCHDQGKLFIEFYLFRNDIIVIFINYAIYNVYISFLTRTYPFKD